MKPEENIVAAQIAQRYADSFIRDWMDGRRTPENLAVHIQTAIEEALRTAGEDPLLVAIRGCLRSNDRRCMEVAEDREALAHEIRDVVVEFFGEGE